MTRRTKWQRERPTLGQVQAAIAWQAPPGTTLHVDPERAAPVQHESREQTELTNWALRQWWWKGYMHHEGAAAVSAGFAHRQHREGKRSGMPDVTVMIPEFWRCVRMGGDWGVAAGEHLGPILLALELKRVDAIAKSTKAKLVPEWWLRDLWPWELRGEVENQRSKHHGVTWAQARALRTHANCGYRTMVAYGAEEAKAWLAEMCGPEPAVLPDWGW